MASREKFVYIAKVAEQAEHFDEVIKALKCVAKMGTELTLEERNLLSVGYKNVIDAKRASLRILASIESKEDTRGNENRLELTAGYRHKVEAELDRICCDVIDIIDTHLIPFSSGAESSVFYYKMKGDYYRYLAEFKLSTEKIEVSDQSLQAYETASKTAEANLSPTHPIRLGLALNISAFHYEIMNSPDRACQLAKKAFDEAVSELDSLSEESNKDSTLIMQLLSDNITLWSSDMADDAEDARQGTEATGMAADPVVVEERKGKKKRTLLLCASRMFPTPPPPERPLRRSSVSFKEKLYFVDQDLRESFPHSTTTKNDVQILEDEDIKNGDDRRLDLEKSIVKEKISCLIKSETPPKIYKKMGRQWKYLNSAEY